MKPIFSLPLCLLLPVFLLLGTSCGSDAEKDSESTTNTSYTYAADVEPILRAGCSGASTCHGAGETHARKYAADFDTFIGDATEIRTRLKKPSTDALSMPPPGSGISLSNANRQILLDYLAQDVKK